MKALRVLGWLLFAAAAVGVSAYLDGAYYTFSVGVAAFSPYLMLAALPALLFFLLGRQRLGAVLAVAVVAFLVVTTAPLYVADDRPADARTVRVLTINLLLGQADPTDVVDVVRRTRPDFLMLEELTTPLQTALETAGLDTLLPHHASDTAPREEIGTGTGLWSRYPIRPQRSLGLTLRSIVVRADVPGLATDPTVVALHVAGPVPNASDWSRDMRVLPGRLADLPSDAPVVVGGDFNGTHSLAPFRRLLDNGYADAADQAGAGLTLTYPSALPMIGIDHVLTRGGTGLDVRVLTVKDTDHRGLLAVVALPR